MQGARGVVWVANPSQSHAGLARNGIPLKGQLPPGQITEARSLTLFARRETSAAASLSLTSPNALDPVPHDHC